MMALTFNFTSQKLCKASFKKKPKKKKIFTFLQYYARYKLTIRLLYKTSEKRLP